MCKIITLIILFLVLIIPVASFAEFAPQYDATNSGSITAFDIIKTKFTDRFTSFLADMKTISLFSVVDSLDVDKNGAVTGNISPEGAVMSFDAGQYGTINYDFSATIPPFSILLLRSIIVLLTLFACLTFIVKTGGS